MAVDSRIQKAAKELFEEDRYVPHDIKYSKNVWSQEDFALGSLIGNVLEDGTNSGNNKTIAEGIYYKLSRSHRVLQANALDVMFRVIEKMADQGTDARNEYYIKRAKEIKNVLNSY